MASEETVALRHRFEMLKGAEQHKNALIEVLHGRSRNADEPADGLIRNFCNILSNLLKITARRKWIMLGNLISIETFKGGRCSCRMSLENTDPLW